MKTTVKSEYDIQAEKFVNETAIEIVKTYTGHRLYFDGDKDRRATFHITIKRGDSSFSYDFGQSIMESYLFSEKMLYGECGGIGRFLPIKQSDFRFKAVNDSIKSQDEHLHPCVRQSKAPPTDYSLLSCMASDSYCAGSFEDWCDSFGYDTDSRKALNTFLMCQKIAFNIIRFFTEAELEQLQQIN